MKNKLSTLRKERNKTQKELSNYLQTTQQTYSRYENGEREPDYTTLCMLADYFNVSVDYILGRENHIDTTNLIKSNIGISEVQELFDLLDKNEQDAIIKMMKTLINGKNKQFT